MELQETSIVLMGIKHCGKSTLGKALASRLECPFFDTDDLITELTQKTPRQIFTEQGAEGFEKAECNACKALAKKSEDEVQKTEIPAEKTLPFEESKEEIAFVPVEEKDFTSEESLAYNDETLSGNDEIAYEEVFLDEFDSPEASSDDSLRDYSEDFDEDFEQIAVREDDYEDDYEDDDGLEYEEIPFYVEALDNEDAFDGEDAFENTLEDALEDDKVPEEIAFADELEALQSEEEEFEEDFLPDLNENSGELVLAENLSPLEETFEPEEDDLDAVIDAELEDYDEALLAENDKNEDFAEEEIAMEEYEEDFEDEDEYSAIVLVPVDSILPDSSSDTNDYEEDFEDEEFIIKEIAEIPAEKDQIVSPLPLDVSTSISGKPDFSKYLVSSSGELKTGSYYIQIATYSADSSIQNVVDNYAKNYPITIVPLSMSKQVLIGPLNVDEYAVVLERFKSYGFENSFMRLVK